MSSDPLITRLKHLIVETLNLEDINPDGIDENAPLIGSGLALDSIDALELVVKLEKEFGLKISSSEESKSALASVKALADFIRERTSGGGGGTPRGGAAG
jgi:acyl carrier protein